MVGAQKDADMTSCFTFRTRKDHEEIPFDDSSVILTEKTALNLGVKVGIPCMWKAPMGGGCR